MTSNRKAPPLGPLEMAVLGLLADAPLCVADVQNRLAQQGQALAYTTVMTVLVRLAAKGCVTREKQGRQFLYSQGRGAHAVRQSVLSRVTKALFLNDKLRPFAAFLGDDRQLTRDELVQMRQLLDAKIKSHNESGAS